MRDEMNKFTLLRAAFKDCSHMLCGVKTVSIATWKCCLNPLVIDLSVTCNPRF